MPKFFFKCGLCNTPMLVDECWAGSTIECSACRKSTPIPAPKLAVTCPSCAKTVEAAANLQTETVSCPFCKTKMQILALASNDTDAAEEIAPESSLAALTAPPVIVAAAPPLESPSAVVAPSANCPSCRAPVALDDVICVQCGTNISTGERIRPRIKLSHPAADAAVGSPVQKPTEYVIRFASGKGGQGTRLKLRGKGRLCIGHLGRVTVEGKLMNQSANNMAILAAFFATAVTAAVVRAIAASGTPCAGPGGCIWYLIFAKMFGVEAPEDLSLSCSGHGAGVYHDRRCWLSLEVTHGEWASFVPTKSSSIFSATDRAAYSEIKKQLQTTMGNRLRPK